MLVMLFLRKSNCIALPVVSNQHCYGPRGSLNSSSSRFPQTPLPFCDWLYSDRLNTIDRYGVSYLLLR
ncbi:hypothetical protein T08_637 [Trichinella sp. T8]|nr:hypothetical protein T08_637 [Trichinella sp. T8]